MLLHFYENIVCSISSGTSFLRYQLNCHLFAILEVTAGVPSQFFEFADKMGLFVIADQKSGGLAGYGKLGRIGKAVP